MIRANHRAAGLPTLLRRLSSWRRGALAPAWCIAVLFSSCPASAQETQKPYDLRLVILCAEHRFLSTEFFREQFPRDIVQRTRLALGPLVNVEAVTEHRLAGAIRATGLDAALVGFDDPAPRRTWFLTVDHQGGLFRVQGRFFDGLTGLLGPPARTATTPDRDRLAPLIAAMIAEPFALVGTVTTAKGNQVELAIHGGGLGEHVRLPVGSVLAVSKVRTSSGRSPAQRLEWAVLETTGPLVAGTVPCVFWHRYTEDAIRPGPDVVYRALVAPTKSAPLRLRVLDRESGRPLTGIGVSVAGQPVEVATDPTGLAVTPSPVSRLARVTLTLNGKTIAQFPAPITQADDAVLCEVSTRAAAESQAGLDVRRRQLITRILDTIRIVDQRFDEQRVLLAGASLEESKKHAEQTLRFLDREIADITAERDDIASAKPHVDGSKGLARLTQLRGVLGDSVARIGDAIRDRDVLSEKRKQAVKLIEQAALLESQAEFDEAIKFYAQAVGLLPEPGKIGEKLAALRDDWEKDRGPKHKESRKHLISTWPALGIDDLINHFAIVAVALEECKLTGDQLTPRRFVRASVDHLGKIKKTMESIQAKRGPDTAAELTRWTEIGNRLRELTNQAVEMIKEK